ncbi:mitochondrial protein C2orf69 homolog [Harmonia axyridis]|uniref:mitochondrial protein C2orf69 homolog n=1 Tax=Harmonia axyridis TaxID=115357 RepID=UPI001E278F40|nr:mitochondrial protein C2orf69 homolog [Harmonia axyridis]
MYILSKLIRTNSISQHLSRHNLKRFPMKGDFSAGSSPGDACHNEASCDSVNFVPAIKVRDVVGYQNRLNDLLYCPPFTDKSQSIDATDSDFGIVVYFGGDIQDFHENMVKKEKTNKFTVWSLENTAKLLSCHYKTCHIVTVRPLSIEDGIFSNYSNFVQSMKYGIPKFVPNHGSLYHLQILLKNLQIALNNLDYQEIKTRLEDTCRALNFRQSHFPEETDYKRNLNDCPIYVVGFSKGCVVLNQFLHEFSHFKDSNDEEVNNLMGRIRAMSWLDGGHSGKEGTWVISEEILADFAKMGKQAFVHVTPYQVRCPSRPWIRQEEEIFTRVLTSKNLDITRKLHFENAECTLDNHFQLLKEVFAPNP